MVFAEKIVNEFGIEIDGLRVLSEAYSNPSFTTLSCLIFPIWFDIGRTKRPEPVFDFVPSNLGSFL